MIVTATVILPPGSTVVRSRCTDMTTPSSDAVELKLEPGSQKARAAASASTPASVARPSLRLALVEPDPCSRVVTADPAAFAFVIDTPADDPS